jgi:hypothetical protein
MQQFKKKAVDFNLDVIISVGYRVKSKQELNSVNGQHIDYGIKLVA